MPQLLRDIAERQPKVIICVGSEALTALTSEGAIARARGKLLAPLKKIRVGTAKIIATYHPASALLDGHIRQQILDAISEDFGYAQNLVNPTSAGGHRTLLPEGYKSSELIDALHSIQSARELACDLEWLAIPGRKVAWPWTPTYQLSMSLTGRFKTGMRTVAFAWPPPASAFSALRSFLATRPLIFHNAMADVIWLLFAGFEPIVGGDSMLLAYLLDEHRRAGLKGLAPLVAGVESGWEQKPWHRRPVTRKGWLELLGYNAGDTENTLSLHDALLAQLAKLPRSRRENLLRVYRSLLLPAVKPFARIALEGVPINPKRLAYEVRKQERLYRKAIARLAKRTGLRPDVAERLANSPAQVTRFARDAYGLEVDSSREDELAAYAGQYPALRDIKEIKHLRKMRSTYIEPWQRLIKSQRDNRLHSIYLLGATRTGRLSAELEEGGSLLLTPRAYWVRDLVDGEHEDGDYELLVADYSQLELRIAAWLAPEQRMRALYAAGEDLHRTSAAYMIAKREADINAEQFWKQRKKWQAKVDKEDRQKAKGENFGLLYGMQEAHFRKYVRDNYQVEMTESEAHDTYGEHFVLYPDLKPWHERAVAEAERRGYTLTPFGRYRYGVEPTQAINTPIQSTGSDLAVFALTVIDERFLSELSPRDARLVGFAHDCVIVRSLKSKRSIVERIIQETMEHPPLERVGIDEIPVPLVAEVLKGATWAKAK
jgi:DNA polymerase I-like protein with 3'-5' exonuclease and polymerase domains